MDPGLQCHQGLLALLCYLVVQMGPGLLYFQAIIGKSISLFSEEWETHLTNFLYPFSQTQFIGCFAWIGLHILETYLQTLGFRDFLESLSVPQPQAGQVRLGHQAWQSRYLLGHPFCLGVLATQESLKGLPD